MPYVFVARTEPVRKPKFSSDNACDKIVARTHALSLPVRPHPKSLNYALSL